MSLYAMHRRNVMNAPSHRKQYTLIATVLVTGFIALIIYSGAAWNWFRPMVYKPLINQYAAQYKFDPLWVMSVIRVESHFESSAESHKGAVGLMQLMPSTARQLAPEVGIKAFQDDDLKTPDVNLRIGCYYLSRLATMFPDDEIAQLSAYNAGPGITQQWRQGKPAMDLDDIEYPETRKFIKQVQKTYALLKALQGSKHRFGIDNER